jgi:hypothetical protein
VHRAALRRAAQRQGQREQRNPYEPRHQFAVRGARWPPAARRARVHKAALRPMARPTRR